MGGCGCGCVHRPGCALCLLGQVCLLLHMPAHGAGCIANDQRVYVGLSFNYRACGEAWFWGHLHRGGVLLL